MSTPCEQMKAVFDKYAGEDGLLDKEECKKMMLEELGVDCEKIPPPVKAMLMSQHGPVDPNKKVSWEEFKELMKKLKDERPEMAQIAQQRLQQRCPK